MSANGIAVESKITLSRNVKGFPFPSRLRDTRANVIASGVYEAVGRQGGYELYKTAQMSEQVTKRLRERGLITDRLIQSPYGSAIVSADESVSIMINEEDAVAANPDVILTNVNYIEDSVGEILSRAGWEAVTAVANEDVHYIDNGASSLPNQHIVDALIEMAVAVYPEAYADYAAE